MTIYTVKFLILQINKGFDEMCNGRADGNYQVRFNNGVEKPNHFLQCSNGKAHCQACWPSSLEFSETCNQCLYNRDGKYNNNNGLNVG